MKWRRNVGILFIVAVIVGALWYGYRAQPVLVEAAAVTRGPLEVTVQEEGRTRVRDRYVVSAPVAGTIRRIDRDVGDPVEPSETLVYLTPVHSAGLDPRSRAEAEARLAASRSALSEAEENVRAATADADFAAAELARMKELFAQGTVSKYDLEQAEATARRTAAQRRSAEFALEVARHEVEAAETALRHYEITDWSDYEVIRIRSPVRGRVLKIVHESAGVVAAGEDLIEIGDPRALEVEVDVLSADAVKISEGTRVVFERWGGPQPLEGRVRVIEPAGFTKISALGVEEQRVLVIADITSPVELWAKLGDGYRVEARFILWSGDDTLRIPSSALFHHGEGQAVFTIDPTAKEARLRPVRVGHRSGLSVEILEGLRTGELVIAHPPDALEDGSPVKVQK